MITILVRRLSAPLVAALVGALLVTVPAPARAEVMADYKAGHQEGRHQYPQKTREAANSWCGAEAGLRTLRREELTTPAHARGCIDGANSESIPRLGPEGGFPF